MLKKLSIKELYVLALAEGEGVGTAYEYYAKRLTLSRWLKKRKRPSCILIAGLPEKYGSSLDFLQLAVELGAEVTVVDERPSALEKLQTSLAAAQKEGWLTDISPQIILVTNVAALDDIDTTFDLCISSEVLQRQSKDERETYCQRLYQLGTAVALFIPNGDNSSHTHISGLSGVALDELKTYSLRQSANSANRLFAHAQTGYIDMPPFPPGIARSDEQREQATSGKAEALAMWGLGYYARMERFLPTAVLQRQSHIIYALFPVRRAASLYPNDQRNRPTD